MTKTERKQRAGSQVTVFPSVLPVRYFPRGSVPNDSWKPGGHDGSGVAVGDQQRSVTHLCLWPKMADGYTRHSCFQFLSVIHHPPWLSHTSIRPSADVPEAWDSSSQPLPRNPSWEGAGEAAELPEVPDGPGWWCSDQDGPGLYGRGRTLYVWWPRLESRHNQADTVSCMLRSQQVWPPRETLCYLPAGQHLWCLQGPKCNCGSVMPPFGSV